MLIEKKEKEKGRMRCMFVKRGKVVGSQGVINSTTRPCEEGRNTWTHEWNKNNPDSIYLKIWKKNPTSRNGSNITQYISWEQKSERYN